MGGASMVDQRADPLVIAVKKALALDLFRVVINQLATQSAHVHFELLADLATVARGAYVVENLVGMALAVSRRR